MEIRQIANAPLSANKRAMSFGYNLAAGWKPFLTEIYSNAAKKCVGNRDGDYYRKLTQDFKNLNTEKIDLTKIINYAKQRIMNSKNYDEKAMKEFNDKTTDIFSKIETPNDVDIMVSKPYWGITKTEKVAGETYEQNVTDSFIDFIIPGTDFIYSHKLDTQKRFFCFGTHDDDFYFARKRWNNFDNDNITPFGQMIAEFNEALIKGFEDLYESLTPKNTGKGSGKIAPNMNEKSLNSNFIYFY